MADLTGLMSSKWHDWSTPDWFFRLLDKIVGGFNLDPCATEITAKCERYFTPEIDGLKQSWGGAGTKAFINSPYGNALPAWSNKTHEEHLHGAECVQLVPARMETRWFQAHAPHTRAMWFPNKRIRFLRPCSHPECGRLTIKLYKAVVPDKGGPKKVRVPWCDEHRPNDDGQNSPTFGSCVLFFTYEDYDLDPLRKQGLVIEARGYNPLLYGEPQKFYRDRSFILGRLAAAAAEYYSVQTNGQPLHPELYTKEEVRSNMFLALMDAGDLLKKGRRTQWTPDELGPLFAWRS